MNNESSKLFGISVRAWIALVLTLTVCLGHLVITAGVVSHAVVTKDFSLVGTLTTIGEPLYSMAVGALGFYFGQKNQPAAAAEQKPDLEKQ